MDGGRERRRCARSAREQGAGGLMQDMGPKEADALENRVGWLRAVACTRPASRVIRIVYNFNCPAGAARRKGRMGSGRCASWKRHAAPPRQPGSSTAQGQAGVGKARLGEQTEHFSLLEWRVPSVVGAGEGGSEACLFGWCVCVCCGSAGGKKGSSRHRR